MPIHDWTRVDAGTWHDMHLGWIAELRKSFNRSLPEGYYVQAERNANRYQADVLTLEEASNEIMADVSDEGGVATAPPQTRVTLHGDDAAHYAAKRRTLAVRHESGDRLVAIIELTSPGNKDRRSAVEDFVAKAADAVAARVNVSIIDLFPPRRFDEPGGLCGAVAEGVHCGVIELNDDTPLCTAGIDADHPPTLYGDPLAIGDELPELPVFLRPGRYVTASLAETYAAAYDAVPSKWKKVLDA
ncbi:MAG: DUF4058 family protein [Planctomycetota bacterium]